MKIRERKNETKLEGRRCGSDGGEKYCEEVSSYIKSLLYSLSYVRFYNRIKSNTLVSLQAGGCCIKKKSWRNSMQLIKDMQFEFTRASITG